MTTLAAAGRAVVCAGLLTLVFLGHPLTAFDAVVGLVVALGLFSAEMLVRAIAGRRAPHSREQRRQGRSSDLP